MPPGILVTLPATISEEVVTVQQANICRTGYGNLGNLSTAQLSQVVFDKLHWIATFLYDYHDCNTDSLPRDTTTWHKRPSKDGKKSCRAKASGFIHPSSLLLRVIRQNHFVDFISDFLDCVGISSSSNEVS